MSKINKNKSSTEIKTGNITNSKVEIVGRDKITKIIIPEPLPEIKYPLPPNLNNITPPEPNFVGCVDTLNTITSWYKSKDVHIGELIGWGGVGKSALVRRWHDSLKENNISPDGIFWWGFYRNAYLDRFLDSLLEYLAQGRINLKEIKGTWQKIDKIKEYIHQAKYLLILDGLEQMQKGESGDEFGKMLYPELTELLHYLADAPKSGLCLITTRYPIKDLESWHEQNYKTRALIDLSIPDALAMLKGRGVKGNDEDMIEVIKRYKGHALSLTSVAGYLIKYYDGDIKHAPDIEFVFSDKERFKDVNKLLSRYEEKMSEAERVFLNVFSLFRKEVTEKEFTGIFRQKIDGTRFNDALVKMSELDFKDLVNGLVDWRLISYDETKKTWTTHPIIKNYFEYVFEEKDKKLCHKRLYEYFGKNAPDEPKTLEEMQGLFEQIYHGCSAGMYEKAFYDVYWQKVQRRNEGFLIWKLGAWDTYLGLIRNFFPEGDFQKEPLVKNPISKSWLINEAGISMMMLGHLKEVEPLYRKSIESYISQREWKNASVGDRNLANLQILRSNLLESKKNSDEAIRLSRKAKEIWHECVSTAYLAYTLFLLGKTDEASLEFEKANELERKDNPSKKYLYSHNGIQYADFLLAQGRIDKALEVTKENFKICEENDWINTINLCHRSYASIYRHQKKFKEAEEHILIAIEAAKKTGRQDIEAESMIEFAKIKLDCHAPPTLRRGTRPTGRNLMCSAESTVIQALRICERCGYKLYEADCRNILSQIYLRTSRPRESKKEDAKFQSICNQTGYKPHGSTI